jgi:23S rRNA pseudouridine2605 synthase
MSIGRLDLNSEGLLLLTNDGDLKRKLELPSTGWSRKYRVRINGNPSQENLEPLRTGITLNNEKFKPMTILIDRQQGANAWLTITLKEGRNREIRRALNEIGFKVSRLIRISYGPFKLDQLKPNEVEEIKRGVLRDQLNNVFDLKADANLSVKTKKRKIKNSYSDLQNPSKQIKHRRK